MTLRYLKIGAIAAAALAAPWAAPGALAQDGLYIPTFVYRTGAYAPSGIPIADGFKDYFTLLNERDGGIEGVKVIHEECETNYDTKVGVECYERLKSKGPLMINPYSTGITYALIPKAPVDKIPILSMGYGRTDAAAGNVHAWVFTTPTGYWSQSTAKIKYIASKEGGLDKLKGKKIINIYHNSPYGKETIPVLDVLAKKYGFEVDHLAVDHPGQEQKATWLKVRQASPDWIIFRGWGVMNQVGVKEAAAIGFPMDHIVAVWWSGSEADVLPAGDGAKGFISATFHAPGKNFKIHEDIKKFVYAKNKGSASPDKVGEVLYNRGLVNAMITAEAVREAVKKHGAKVTGEQTREGMENLNLTQDRLDKLGFGQMMKPIKVTCSDHEGNGPVVFQQWDGKEWKLVSDWVEPMRDVVRPMVEESAKKFADENKITPRQCPSS